MSESTSKRRKKQTEEVTEVKYLESGDLLKCETLTRDMQNAKLLMHVEEQSLRNLNLEAALMQVRIEKQKELVAKKSSELGLVKERYEQYMQAMWPKYGIDPADKSLGYNPETGEIAKN